MTTINCSESQHSQSSAETTWIGAYRNAI